MIIYTQHTIVTEEKLICNQPKRDRSTIQLSAGAACERKAVRWDSSNAVMCPPPHSSNAVMCPPFKSV